MMTLKKLASVADILEREIEPTIKEWLRRVKMVPELVQLPLSDTERTGHLRKLFQDLICRLRLVNDTRLSLSASAAAHGEMRRAQGYSAAMVIDESRAFQVATFSTLHLHQGELDQNRMLLDVIVIADEVDAQLMETVRSLVGPILTKSVA
jgi:hypothetical protein